MGRRGRAPAPGTRIGAEVLRARPGQAGGQGHRIHPEIGHGRLGVGAPGPPCRMQQPGALAGGEADAVGRLAELAVQLHLALPVRLGVGHGAGEDLQAVLVLVAPHRLAAGHALAVQADVSVGEHLGAGPHDLDSQGPYGPVTSPISGRSRPVRWMKCCRPTRLV